jgi:hypothetical protein
VNDDVATGCLFIVMVFIVVAGAVCLIDGHNDSYKEGYVQALVDIERKRPLTYKRVEQENGETIWIKNEEKGK